MEAFSETNSTTLDSKPHKRYLDKERQKKRIIGHILSTLVVIAAVSYLIWCISNANLEYWYAFIPFIVAEFVFLILLLLWINILWNKRFHNPKGEKIKNDPLK